MRRFISTLSRVVAALLLMTGFRFLCPHVDRCRVWLSTLLLTAGIPVACLTVCLGLAAGTRHARAEIVTFTLTGPAIQGTLGGVPFDAPFTITAQADPASMTFSPFDYGGYTFTNGALPATSTITIGDLSPVVFTDALFGPNQLDLSPFIPGYFVAGFGLPDPSAEGGAYGFFAQGLVAFNALDEVSFGVSQGFSFATSGGELIVDTNTVGSASYGPIVSSTAVPEIDPAGLGSVLALVTGSLGLLERRRRWRR